MTGYEFDGVPVLRFERLMQLLRDHCDPRLALLKQLCGGSEPTEAHFALAQLARDGHRVITVNFDSLIERAASKLDFTLDTVCTSSTFDRWQRSRDFSTPVLFALHGSFLQWRAGHARPAESSVQATLDDIGKYGVGFVGAPAKKKLLSKSIEDRDLVVLGYSGSDDFDVSLILGEVQRSRQVFWVEHIDDPKQCCEVIIERGRVPCLPPDSRAPLQLLTEMAGRCLSGKAVSLIRVPTLDAVRVLRRACRTPICQPPKVTSDKDRRTRTRNLVQLWKRRVLHADWHANHLAGEILAECDAHAAAARCASAASRHAGGTERAICLGHLRAAGDWASSQYASALRRSRALLSDGARLRRPLSIRATSALARLEHLVVECTFFSKGGRAARGAAGDALSSLDRLVRRACREAVPYVESSRGDILSTLGNVALDEDDLAEAERQFDAASRVYERRGVVEGFTYCWAGKADCLRRSGRTREAARLYAESSNIAIKGRDHYLAAWCQLYGGRILMDELTSDSDAIGFARCLEMFSEARQRFAKVGDRVQIGHVEHALGDLYRLGGRVDGVRAAQQYYRRARARCRRGLDRRAALQIEVAIADCERLLGRLARARARIRVVLGASQKTSEHIVGGNAYLVSYAVDRVLADLDGARSMFARSAIPSVGRVIDQAALASSARRPLRFAEIA